VQAADLKHKHLPWTEVFAILDDESRPEPSDIPRTGEARLHLQSVAHLASVGNAERLYACSMEQVLRPTGTSCVAASVFL